MEEIELIFDHVGIPTDDKQPNENWVETTRVWVTNPREHKYRIEYLRFEPDTPVLWEVSHLPHIAYSAKAQDFDKLLQGVEIIIEPFEPHPNMKIAYVKKHDALVEYIVYKDPDYWFDVKYENWFPKAAVRGKNNG